MVKGVHEVSDFKKHESENGNIQFKTEWKILNEKYPMNLFKIHKGSGLQKI